MDQPEPHHPQAYEMLCPRPRWSCYAMCFQNLRSWWSPPLPGCQADGSRHPPIPVEVGRISHIYQGFGIHFRWLGMNISEPSTVPLPATTGFWDFDNGKTTCSSGYFFCTLTESSGSKNPCRKLLSGGKLWDSMVCDLSCYPSKPKFLKPCLKLKDSASPDTPEPCLYRFDLCCILLIPTKIQSVRYVTSTNMSGCMR